MLAIPSQTWLSEWKERSLCGSLKAARWWLVFLLPQVISLSCFSTFQRSFSLLNDAFFLLTQWTKGLSLTTLHSNANFERVSVTRTVWHSPGDEVRGFERGIFPHIRHYDVLLYVRTYTRWSEIFQRWKDLWMWWGIKARKCFSFKKNLKYFPPHLPDTNL